jgi:hypothetical protein
VLLLEQQKYEIKFDSPIFAVLILIIYKRTARKRMTQSVISFEKASTAAQEAKIFARTPTKPNLPKQPFQP